jgi:TolB protein
MIKPAIRILFCIGTVGVVAAARDVQQPPPSQQPEVNVVIAGGGRPQPRLGLPEFTLASGDADLKTAATTVTAVLANDIEFEEVFLVVDRKRSASIPVVDTIEKLPVEDWTNLGAEYVLLATARKAGPALQVQMQVVAVKDGPQRVKMGPTQINCTMNAPRVCAHYIADEMHLKLAGLQGVAQSRIAFVSNRDAERSEGVYSRSGKEIYIADYDGYAQQRVTATRVLNLGPSMSPDGQTLAYASYRSNFPDIYLQPIYAVGGLRRPAKGSDVNQNQMPAFSPDGSRIAFTSNRDGNYEIYVVDREGRQPAVRVTNSPAADLAPTWSPDGTQIAFVSDRSSVETPLLYTTSADGVGGAQRLYASRADRPSWSPLGNLIAFTCGTSGGFDICVFEFGTNQVRKITDGIGTNEQPVFAPNGQHIMFVTTRWGKKQLATINIKGTSIRRLTESGDNESPAWSPARKK